MRVAFFPLSVLILVGLLKTCMAWKLLIGWSYQSQLHPEVGLVFAHVCREDTRISVTLLLEWFGGFLVG
jgi:hypothetical protein